LWKHERLIRKADRKKINDFRARQFEFVFPRPALVMGIVNVTPDSFLRRKIFDPARPLRVVGCRAGAKSDLAAIHAPARRRGEARNCAASSRWSNNWRRASKFRFRLTP